MSRPATTTLLPTSSTPSFIIGQAQKSYRHQYSNIYFIRLRLLRDFVEQTASQKWDNIEGSPRLVPRVLEVTKGHLCYIIGTVYMEMPLKPNVMEDLTRDRSIQAPPPAAKIYSPEDGVTLEDESGRIHLVGDKLNKARLVTGVIVAALGMETPNGDFEVVDILPAGLAPQTSAKYEEVNDESQAMEVDGEKKDNDSWIAVVSGLDVGSDYSSDARIQMLAEYLSGETEIGEDEVPPSQITRLILAGDSLSSAAIAARADAMAAAEDKKSKKQAQDAAVFETHPMHTLGAHLLDIGRSLPIHVLPGELDPSAVILPQQPLPRAMFGPAAKLPTFFTETNPTYLRVVPGEIPQPEDSEDSSYSDSISESHPEALSRLRTILVNSGQPLNDLFKYLPNRANSRLAILESTLKWRHMSPTAPDTLWCHPYLSEDPFIFYETPDLYIVGGQKRFGTKLVVDEEQHEEQRRKTRCRIVMVPHFSRTGVLVLVNMRTLDVKCLQFAFEGMRGGGDKDVGLDDLRVPLLSQMPVEPMPSLPEPTGSPGPM